MKTLLLSAVAVMAFGVAAQAQEVSFGAKAGANFATFTGDAEDAKMKTGFHVGVVAEIKFSENFSVQPELMYSAQGAKEEYSEEEFGFTINYEDNAKLSYINLPIVAKYYVMEGLSLEVGPQVGFLLSAEVESEASFEGETESATTDIKDSTKSIDFGIVGGLGYELPMGLFFQARYNVGLSNLNDTDTEYSYKNSVIQVSVGYKFM